MIPSRAFNQALERAHQEAGLFGAPEVGPEHLLIGIIWEADGAMDKLFIRLGLNISSVRGALLDLMGEPTLEQKIPPTHFSQEAEKVVQKAHAIAQSLRTETTDLEHLLVALLCDPTGRPATILGLLALGRHEVCQRVLGHDPAAFLQEE